MTYKVTQSDFIQVLVDCKGYSKDEAENLANEYRNDIGAYLSDIGGDENSLVELKNFLA